MATVTTLLRMPAQPLPPGDLVDSVFITIWWVAVTVFALVLSWLLRIRYAGDVVNWLFPRTRATWELFRSICLAAGVLGVHYFFLAIDRWLHYDQRASVVYGYIIFLTLIESLKVFSAVIFAWGSYKIVWVEIQIFFDLKWQGYLWMAAKVGLFLVSLMSIFYAVLYVALAGVWLDFRSLNSIADIATKRTSFEVATAGLLAAFAGLAFGNAVWAVVRKAAEVDGRGNSAWKNRFLLLIATFLFFLRSLVEFGMLVRILGSDDTRATIQRARDVSYGLLTCFYLLAMCFYASMVASPDDKGKADTQDVRQNVRRYIEERISTETGDAAIQARPFIEILVEVEEDFKKNTDSIEAKFSAGSGLSPEANRATIEGYFAQLRANYGHLGLQTEPDVASPYGSTASFFSHFSGSGRRTIFGSTPEPDGPGRKKSGWSLRDSFRSRESTPPTVQPLDDRRIESTTTRRPLSPSTASSWSRTENMSRRGSVMGQRHASAPIHMLPTQHELPDETSAPPNVPHRGRPNSGFRVVSDSAAYTAHQRHTSSPKPPASPQELHQTPRPAVPRAPYNGSPQGLPRQRPFQPTVTDETEQEIEMHPIMPYRPPTISPAGSLNPYADRARSRRRQERAGSEMGVPGTPFLQQSTPQLAQATVNRQYTATPVQVQSSQGMFPQGDARTNGSSSRGYTSPMEAQVGTPVPPLAPAVGAYDAPPRLYEATQMASPSQGTPGQVRPTMRFQGARNRRVVGQGSPSQTEG